MCTLIVFHRCFSDAALVVAANRDEYLDRPAEPPALRRWQDRMVLTPRDVRAGGTWLGLNDVGVFAAITNRPNPSPDPTRRSRGLLVSDTLAAASAAEAAEQLLALPARTYNPFNLFVSDGHDAYVAVYEEKTELRILAAGPHVIGNGDPDSRRLPKVARLLDEAERVARGSSDEALEALAQSCARHRADAPALESTCIHAGPYGTRSSALLRLGASRQADSFRFASGPPCTAPYDDFTPLLAQLDQTGMSRGATERTHA